MLLLLLLTYLSKCALKHGIFEINPLMSPRAPTARYLLINREFCFSIVCLFGMQLWVSHKITKGLNRGRGWDFFFFVLERLNLCYQESRTMDSLKCSSTAEEQRHTVGVCSLIADKCLSSLHLSCHVTSFFRNRKKRHVSPWWVFFSSHLGCLLLQIHRMT